MIKTTRNMSGSLTANAITIDSIAVNASKLRIENRQRFIDASADDSERPLLVFQAR